MGTITEKLSYLNTTRTMLRDSLNKFGSNILSTDTFRSYDTKLNEIYDKLPKVTQSGAGFTLLDVQNGQVDDFKMNGVDLEQDTTTGKNLLNISDITSGNGIKNNNNKSITLNGNIASTSFTLTNPITLKANATYIMSLTNNDTNAGDSTFILRNGNTNKMIIYFKNLVSNAPFTPTEDIIIDTLRIYNSGVTFNNYTFSIQLEEGSSSTSFEPYTGGIPSPNPDYPQEIKVVEGRQVITDKGKNLLDSSKIQTITQNGITCTYNSEKQEITFNGTCTSDNTLFYFNSTNIYAKKNITKFIAYYVSGAVENYVQLRFYDSNYRYGIIMNIINLNSSKDKITMYSDDRVNTSNYVNNSFKFNNGSVANNFKIKVMVTDDENTDYELYYEPVSYNIDLSLENIQLAKMPNSTYKNRIYKNNGNWYFEENVKKVIFDGSEDENWTIYLNTKNYVNIWQGSPRIMCNYFKPTTNNSWISSDDSYRGMCSSLNTAGTFKCMTLTNMTMAEFKTWLSTHNVIVWYELQNPVTTQITNTTLINQLETISVHTGTNIITISNDNNIIPEIEITRLKELEKLV